MRYRVEEKIKSLKQFLNHLKKRPYNRISDKTEGANKIWNASLFFTNILLASDYSGYEITENEFQIFTRDYENKIIITKDLINVVKFWNLNLIKVNLN